MKKPTVFVTRNIPESGLTLLKKKYALTINKNDRVLTPAELLKGVKGKDALLCLLTDKIDNQFIKKNPQLKIIANYAVGFDNIDIASAKQHNIPVTNTPGVLTDAVAEHTCALILSLSRRVVESDMFTRKGKYVGWAPLLFLGNALKGKVLGIVGGGRIGTAVAECMHKGFGMNIVYVDHKHNTFIEKNAHGKKVSLNTLLKKADIVSLHLPLLPTTHHFISKKEFSLMKPSTLLINTSRGAVVDEKALVTALKNKIITGAALDVFENEPSISSGLKTMSQVILTPHIASATVEAREAMSVIAAKNILAALSGKKLLNPV